MQVLVFSFAFSGDRGRCFPGIKKRRKTPCVFLPPSIPERFPAAKPRPVAPLVCFLRPILLQSHFPKSRPDPILLPESFCIPLRLCRGSLSRVIHPGYSVFGPSISVVFPLLAVKCFFVPGRGVTSGYFPNKACHSARFRVKFIRKAVPYFNYEIARDATP